MDDRYHDDEDVHPEVEDGEDQRLDLSAKNLKLKSRPKLL